MKSVEILSLPRVRYAHAFQTKSYQHTFPPKDDWLEISYISEGKLVITCNGEEYIAQKGDIICLCCYPHSICVKTDELHEHHTVIARVKWERREDARGLCLPMVTPESLHTKKAAKQIEEFVCNPLLFQESPSKGAVLFLDLLAEIDRCNRNARKEHSPQELLYSRRAKEYVQQHLHSSMEQRRVAAHLGLSPEYLCAVFKKTEGMSFIRYVNTQKLESVKMLMEKEDLPLYEAAARLGYGDPNYVSRLYKRYYGHNITDKTHRINEES